MGQATSRAPPIVHMVVSVLRFSRCLSTHREDGVVGIEERVGDDLPGRIPRKILIVNENPHQFRDGKRGVGL